MFSVFGLSGGESISKRNDFCPLSYLSFIALIGTGFPNAVDSADWRFRVDFRCGTAVIVGGVNFLVLPLRRC